MADLDCLDPDGIWCQVLRPVAARRPALFLDRDGVVTQEIHFLHRPQQVVLCPGAARDMAQNLAPDAVGLQGIEVGHGGSPLLFVRPSRRRPGVRDS